MTHFDADNVPNRFADELFKSLINCEFEFYGVDGNCFCIGVNGTRMVLEAVEDPSDGYRSYFSCFRTEEVGRIFFRSPIARVKLLAGGLSTRTHSEPVSAAELHEAQQEFSGWVLKDVVTGHTWLTVGTDYGDDYYPCFTFRYEPDKRNALQGGKDQ